MGKRNVTITLDEEVADWVRVEAAQRRMSVSRLAGELLRERMEAADEHWEAMRDYFSRSPSHLKAPGDRYPNRDELYDRPRLCR